MWHWNWNIFMYYIAISIHGLNIIFKVKKIKMEKLKRDSISPLLEKQTKTTWASGVAQ